MLLRDSVAAFQLYLLAVLARPSAEGDVLVETLLRARPILGGER